MDEKEIKTKLLHYWRFEKNYLWIATEAGRFDADVLASDGKNNLIECEVKVSKQDLRKEFKKKKHFIYSNPTRWFNNFLPTKFYFAIPYELKNLCFELTENTPYGILGVKKTPIALNRNMSYVVLAKKAQNLSSFQEKLHRKVLLRMGSELVRLRLKE